MAIFDLPEDIEPGIEAVKLAQNRIDAFAKRWRASYPGAVRCVAGARQLHGVNGHTKTRGR